MPHAVFAELFPLCTHGLSGAAAVEAVPHRKSCAALWVRHIFAIEVLQMFCGRTTDVDDLLMNTLGALIGYWMFLAAERQTSFCLLRRNKTAEAGVAVSRAFQTLAYEN